MYEKREYNPIRNNSMELIKLNNFNLPSKKKMEVPVRTKQREVLNCIRDLPLTIWKSTEVLVSHPKIPKKPTKIAKQENV